MKLKSLRENFSGKTFLLRFAVAVILVMHSVPSLFSQGVTDFGRYYLNENGFAPIGLPLAWAIKLSHLAGAICLLLDVFTRWVAVITIFILSAGIILLHYREGWFVVGAGRNGMEFNFLLIFALLTIIFPAGIGKRQPHH